MIILDDNLRPKTFQVWGLPRYLKQGVGTRLPDEIGAAIGLRAAIAENCEVIRVQADGERFTDYQTSTVLEFCRKNQAFWNYLPKPQTRLEQIVSTHNVKTGSGFYLPND
jgi:hypothetical protein